MNNSVSAMFFAVIPFLIKIDSEGRVAVYQQVHTDRCQPALL